jgi:cyclic beta-1,2-glucan synthetase
MGDEAMELFHLINPINHMRTGEDRSATRRSRSPWPPTSTRTRCTSGAAVDVVYRVGRLDVSGGVQALLGLRRTGTTMRIDPCIPTVWPEYSLTWRFGKSHYRVTVANPDRRVARHRPGPGRRHGR